MLEALNNILQTPNLWVALGLVSATSMFISPILYNGDYKSATKTLVCVMWYAIFVAFVNYSHLYSMENMSMEKWLQPIIILVLVGIAYAGGLLLGVLINRQISKHNN